MPDHIMPNPKFSTLNLRDDKAEKEFIESLKRMGVPVSDKRLSENIPKDFDE